MLKKTAANVFLFYIAIFLIFSSNAWGAAGEVTIESPNPNHLYETSTGFSVSGTFIMTEDSTPSGFVESRSPSCPPIPYYGLPNGNLSRSPYFRDDYAIANHANLYYKVDETFRSKINEVYTYLPNGNGNFNRERGFSAYVDIRGLDPARTHTVTVYLQDIYAEWCGYDPHAVLPIQRSLLGDLFAQAMLTFKIVLPCDLKLNSFTRSKDIIDPSLGESVTFTGDMTETSGASVQWTVKITDNSGAQLIKFEGGGTSVSVNWDGKDSYGTIVPDGLYTATLEAQTEDGKCKKTATTQVTVKSSCNLGEVSLTPSRVSPQATGGITTTATVKVSLRNPAPSSGCTVKVKVEPVENSGGHMHAGGRPTGSLNTDKISFTTGETGPKPATYTSGEVAGMEKIIAELMDQNGYVVSSRNVSIDVKVPGLSSLGSFIFYNLTGSTSSHSANHYGLPSTNSAIGNVADQYYIETGALLGINDMSLEWGGLFDINGNWSPPHSSHRKGTSVDIDRHAYMNGSYIVVDRQQLDRIATGFDGVLVIEPTIHYEF